MPVTKDTLIRNTIDYGESRAEEIRKDTLSTISGLPVIHTYQSSESIDNFAANLDAYRSDRMISEAIVHALMHSEPFKHHTMGQARILIDNVLSELHNAERE